MARGASAVAAAATAPALAVFFVFLAGSLPRADASECPGNLDPICDDELKTPSEFIRVRASHLGGYHKSVRPPCGNATHAGPTIVEVQLYLKQIGSIDTKRGIIEINGNLRTFWTDPRLRFNSTDAGGCFDEINLDGADADLLWLPDVYVDNMVEKFRFDTFRTLTHIDHMGHVTRSEQINMEVEMRVQLGAVPYDDHHIKIVVASYSQDNTRVRLIPRGGKVGEGESGIGLIAPALSSPKWSFLRNGDKAETEGFQTPGQFQLMFGGSWDYVILQFWFERKPKYFLDQVAIPSVFFLLVSNIQFYVEPEVAPARAFISFIPVLIIRTMNEVVYDVVPEGSQSMWLVDFLMCGTALTLVGVVEFAIVSFLVQVEKRRKEHLTRLHDVKDCIDKIIDHARREGITFKEQLDRCRHMTVSLPSAQVAKEAGKTRKAAFADDGEILEVTAVPLDPDALPNDDSEFAPEGEYVYRLLKSLEARDKQIRERELLVLGHVESIFASFDTNNSGRISATELRQALSYFNVYMSNEQISGVICILLRDAGEITPEDESKACLNLDGFFILLAEFHKYCFMMRRTSLYGRLMQLPPSKRVDLVARIVFPILICFQVVIFFLAVDLYRVPEL